MKRVSASSGAFSALLAFCLRAASAQNVATTEPLSAEEQLKRFHLPPGFEIQLVAAEPDIHKPINLNFDSRGRLYVTDTVEYPYPAKPGEHPRDSVKVLVDRDGDGRAERIATLVEGLNIPLGVAPIPGGTMVYSIPTIDRWVDADGDGRAEKREPLYGVFGSHDTHGMTNSFTRWIDGWVYACHGFSNTSKVQGADGQAITMNSGNTYRMRADGSHVEQHTFGQVNPFGLAFDPLGNLYSADCHTSPAYQLLRGAHYPSFGKGHDGLGFGPQLMHHSHGSTGIGGVAYYAADQFPPEYRDTIFLGNVVTGRVNHDRLEAHGASYRAIEQPDFIRCDDPWFRPVNLALGPDGALYIADFYNRIIGHYEVPLNHPGRDRERGRVWRVVYAGPGAAKASSPLAPPAAASGDDKQPTEPLDVKQLIALLGHANLTVRTLATHELVDRRGVAAIEPLKALLAAADAPAWSRAHGLWALERLESVADETLLRLAADHEAGLRVHLLKLLAERAAWSPAVKQLARQALTDENAYARRAAADAIGRHPAADHVKPLADLWASTPADDPHLIHVVRMALRDQLRAAGVYAELASLVGGDVELRRRLAEVSRGVGTAEAAGFLLDCLRADAGLPDRAANLYAIVRHLPAERLGEVWSYLAGQPLASAGDGPSIVREVRAAAQERGLALPEEAVSILAAVVRQLLASDQEGQVAKGLDLARDAAGLRLFDECSAIATAADRPAGLRQPALEACLAIDAARSRPLLEAALHNGGEPIALRQKAAGLLARANDDSARAILVRELAAAPEALASAIAIGLADSRPGAEALIATIEQGKASPRLLQDRTIGERVRARGLPDIDATIGRLTANLPPADEALKRLIDARRKMAEQAAGDPALGLAVFKKHCAQCHRIGEEGARVGPTLDGVGARGLDRLLEDVLDPNRNVDQAFRATQIVTTDGKIYIGLAQSEAGEVLVLADAQGKELRLPKAEIEERHVSSLSLMPSNAAQTIPEAEFAELMRFLLSQSRAPTP